MSPFWKRTLRQRFAPTWCATGFLAMALALQSAYAQLPLPPVAAERPFKLASHGKTRTDEYFWLRERDNPEVIAYLNAENNYFDQAMRNTATLQQTLLDEIIARIPAAETSAPIPERGFTYYRRITRDQQYPIFYRKSDENSVEQLVLDVNQLAEGKPFCAIGGQDVSAQNDILAYAVDTVGRRKYDIHFRRISDQAELPDVIEDVGGNLVWATDNRTLFYARKDPQTLRSYQIFRHTLGDDPAGDPLVFQEDDTEFECSVSLSRSRKYLLIESTQTLSTEWRFLAADTPTGEFQVFQSRLPDHEYSIDHMGDRFYVRTNWEATNFRIMSAAEDKTGRDQWQEVLPGSANSLIERFELFNKFIAVQSRGEALTRIDAYFLDGRPAVSVDFSESAYTAEIDATPETDTDWLRYDFTSLNTPPSVREFNVRSGQSRVVKEQQIVGGFNNRDYVTRRDWALAADGEWIPVSLVYKRSTRLDGTAPCLLYGYGSYGISMDPDFDIARLNLLDRGFVYAIAHIRGGQEMGRRWYEDGKLLKKVNTFRDFIDTGKYLIAQQIADPQRLYIQGGSAGGLLIGAVLNMRPDLFKGAIADVPFVDVVTTMLDETIPLTTSEYDEWGNPNNPEYYDYMLAYSPYDNVHAADYPPILVTTGLHDSQVQYWEPAKWVARLRRLKTDHNLLLLKTNMEAGHGGASGRVDQYREEVFRQAFLLKLAGLAAK